MRGGWKRHRKKNPSEIRGSDPTSARRSGSKAERSGRELDNQKGCYGIYEGKYRRETVTPQVRNIG